MSENWFKDGRIISPKSDSESEPTKHIYEKIHYEIPKQRSSYKRNTSKDNVKRC